MAAAATSQAPHEAALSSTEVDAVLGDRRFVSLFETRETEHAQAYLSRVYGPHALRLDGGTALNMRLRGFEFAHLHLGEVRYGSPAVASMSQAHGHWVFSYLRSGLVQTDVQQRPYVPGEAAVMAPDSVQRLTMSADMEMRNLRVTQADMIAACRSLLGSDLSHALRFEERVAANSPQTAALLRVMSHLAATPAYAQAAAGRLERSLRDAALYEILLAWPNNYAHTLEQPAALPASTRRARDFIHAHAAELPSIADIAEAAGVGVRALALGFEKHLGISPLRYLQQYRLDRVHEALMAPGGEVTVTEIAVQWGFLQLGSFAARYRERFGETPSQTLRRSPLIPPR
ncbi:AraC family transcriptional regulator [Aquincola sp. S2]|uniref:AraC family transcriptional regulator n=1 Tax=Pseudaquabacterium terrae TaxID=2732868 RepID=A0ABX2EK38_9BURK|nr:AraC family transcriptional regulator [Aquabacterium terrae]NRF68932.1 AraC family transcriptional regulator [Aquabacterium terrae]